MEEDLKKYLLSSDITVTDNKFFFNRQEYFDNNFFQNNTEYCMDKIKQHIILINAVHKLFMKNSYLRNSRIKSSVGKDIEKLKVDIKKLKRNLSNIQIKNNMDEFIFSRGNLILTQAKKATTQINDMDYQGLIKRSMGKNEICLGSVDETNLRVMEQIEVGSIKWMTFNLVEDDIYEYIRKFKSNSMINLRELIKFYISISKLNEESEKYLNNLILIPRDSIRIWKRYLKNKRNYESSYYLTRISNSFKYEVNITGGEDYE